MNPRAFLLSYNKLLVKDIVSLLNTKSYRKASITINTNFWNFGSVTALDSAGAGINGLYGKNATANMYNPTKNAINDNILRKTIIYSSVAVVVLVSQVKQSG
jgi:hypothetical protein